MKSALTVLVVGVLLLSPHNGYSCGCLKKPTFKEAFDQSDFVFIGRVEGKIPLFTDYKTKKTSYAKPSDPEKEPNLYEYKFEAIHVFKGEYINGLLFKSDGPGSSCYYKLDNNVNYLVYATKSEATEFIWIQTCGLTKEVNGSQINLVNEILTLQNLKEKK